MSTGSSASNTQTVVPSLFSQRRRAQQAASLTATTGPMGAPATSQPDSTTPEALDSAFVAAGGRLSSGQLRRRQQSQPASPFSSLEEPQQDGRTFGSSELATSATSTSSATSATSSQAADQEPAASLQRRRRSSGSNGAAIEEFELSLGELLPNLRTLKLELFLDFSAGASGQSGAPSRAGGRRHQNSAGRRLSRSKRHFGAQDAPEMVHDDQLSDDDLPDMEVEPGETLWRAASGSRSSANQPPDEGTPTVVLPPPVSPSTGAPMESGSSWDSLGSGGTGGELAAAAASEPSSARAQLAGQILAKLFSRLTKLRVLQLTGNDIPHWPDGVLQDSRHSLARLYLISNNLRQVSPTSFAHLAELNTLDLSANQLRQLDPNLLRETTNLRHFRASHNLFRRLPLSLLLRRDAGSPSSSWASGKLESFDVSKNRFLEQLVREASGQQQLGPKLASLSSLNLSECSLSDHLVATSGSSNSSSLGDVAKLFESLPELSAISLQKNRLKELLTVAGLFGKNSKLQRLDVSHNQLTWLNERLFNANASQLVELHLHHNNLREIPQQLLFNLKKLRHLSLAHNQLVQLAPSTFQTNLQIETIDLSHNQLVTINTQASKQIPFGKAPNLKRLLLGHNNLSNFDSDFFDLSWTFYANLNLLDLSNNKFWGQISMPIFYTIMDEMLLNLSSNQISSISVEALIRHERDLEISYLETATDPSSSSPAESSAEFGPNSGHHLDEAAETKRWKQQQQQTGNKVPTVNIRLANNPLACDCMLEPLVRYTRRVAAVTNPGLLASVFNGSMSNEGHPRARGQPNGGHSSDTSRYSFSSAEPNGGQRAGRSGNLEAGQPQVLYQFKLNDVYCSQPATLHKSLVSHLSIGDLLCPIVDERVCPSACDCHYQSAFRTAIVDCAGRQLAQVPAQLANSANFRHFEVALLQQGAGGGQLKPPGSNSAATSGAPKAAGAPTQSITDVEKLIIKLDHNRLESIEPLAHLFSLVASEQQQQATNSLAAAEQRQRYARAPKPQTPSAGSSSSSPEASQSLSMASSSVSPSGEHLDSPPVSPQTNARGALADSAPPKRKISPAAIARGMAQWVARPAGGELAAEPRLRRHAPASPWASVGAPDELASGPAPEVELGERSAAAAAREHEATLSNHVDLFGPGPSALDEAGQPQTHQPLSTAVLEKAEQFRNRRYPFTCELHLDHNSIGELPDSFLSQLDQVAGSSLVASPAAPQAALPSSMQEPPVHSKLSHHHLISSAAELAAEPMQPGASDPVASPLTSAAHEAPRAPAEPMDELPAALGRHAALSPFGGATLDGADRDSPIDVAGENGDQFNGNPPHRQHPKLRLTLSPSLVLLSLSHNNIGRLSARMQQRLSKLIKASNTKLYLGHNPFNCSENFLPEPPVLPSSSLDDNHSQDSPKTSRNAAGSEHIGHDSASSSSQLEGNQLGAMPGESDQAPSSTTSDCPVGQLKEWLTSHHSNVADLDELYCVHMPDELRARLNLNATARLQGFGGQDEPLVREIAAHSSPSRSTNGPTTWASAWGHNSAHQSQPGMDSNGSYISKNGFIWNKDVLMAGAKLIDIDLYKLCPYSGNQNGIALGFLSATNQQIVLSVALLFILISLCLLLMLVYFGDTQTILAFIYIHMNPLYNCMHLNESHLDGEKLYDAFVSYSSADRDIVMELIERLEQQQHTMSASSNGLSVEMTNRPTSLDKSRDTLVTEADLRPDLGLTNRAADFSNETAAEQPNGNNRRSASSFQDLSTMSRSTSRVTLSGGSHTGSSTASGLELSPPGRNQRPSGQAADQRPYKLCIHERDWLPGHLISWNIVNSVQNSRRTILILSKEFIKSVWFQVEFHTAYYQMLEDKMDRLIVIVRGELPPKSELDKNLAFLLTTKTYLVWGEKWFWERLHYALPHPSAGAPVSSFGVSQRRSAAKLGAPPLNTYGSTNQTKSSGPKRKAPQGSLLGHALSKTNSSSGGQPNGKPLLMTNIGKDCSNLLPIVNGAYQQGSSGAATSSSSSSSSCSSSNGSQATGSSRNQLVDRKELEPNGSRMRTTHNDLLSSLTNDSPMTLLPGNNTTRLNIRASSSAAEGKPASVRTSSPSQMDSGRLTGTNLSSTSFAVLEPQQTKLTRSSNGMTSILLNAAGSGDKAAPTGNGNGAGLNKASVTLVPSSMEQSGSGSMSKLRAKKQERLQNFVDNEISNHFNLSEL